MMEGRLDTHIIVDALQGGAGTATNMNVNEALANRALQLLGLPPGRYDVVHPLEHVNLHQSTNDTYPTALRVAAIRGLRALADALARLQETLQARERDFAGILRVGRTELQDAVLTTMGRTCGAWAEAVNRDRWRVYKCEERLRVVNLGGTAIGTGLGAPRDYIFRATGQLAALTGLPLARAENLQDATQNQDALVEVSGILTACAANLRKLANDLRLLSSGPQAGLGELSLPPMQAGSSIMPGKVNPVIPEAVCQAALLAQGNHGIVAAACGAGELELNAFLPLAADRLLESLRVLAGAAAILRERCVQGMTVRADRCRELARADTAIATALVPRFGYETVTELVTAARAGGLALTDLVIARGLATRDQLEQWLSPEAVTRLGDPE
jgi:aspartate ammonia-lyase